jgi:HTH-type transcriptional regulator / antitoxin MqsA
MKKLLCPICESASVHEETFSKHLTHRGTAFEVVGLKSMACDECGASFFGAGQAEHNREKVSAAKAEQVLGVKPQWIASFRQRLGITQGEAGRLFGGGKIAFCRYESGTVSPSQALVRLLLLADKIPGVVDVLRMIANDEAEVAPLLTPQELLKSWSDELTRSFEYEGLRKIWAANQGDFDGADLKDAA